MKVLVLGATGGVGRLITDAALQRGHDVTALARHTPRQGLSEQVRFIAGDALDADALDRAVAGQDAVIYSVGAGNVRQTTLFSDSTRLLLSAMQRHGVRRLIAITGVGAGETKGHGGFVYDRLIYPLFTKGVYADKDRQEALIRNSSLDWIIVRPAAFKEARREGDLQTALNLDGVTLRAISRSEVAEFVVDQLDSDRFLRQTPFIGHP